ncbi:MAG: hypothetical protein VYE30_06965 [Pseudomonadota bacterium]|jgi:hypothetical protein|nr:hypothetical protein [Pseudomonadota bacterium]
MKKLFLLFSLFFASSVWGQDQAPEEAETESQNEQQALDTDLSSEELAAAENDELILGDEAEEQEEGANSRFIPTEEISQDLGVSFPVDI